MAPAPAPQDDTKWLIAIFILVFLFLGIAPIVADMYFEVKAVVAERKTCK